MTEDQAVRALPTCPPTYLHRARRSAPGTVVCTTCGSVIGATEADQIRHTTWHATLAELFALAADHSRICTHERAPAAATRPGLPVGGMPPNGSADENDLDEPGDGLDELDHHAP
jgi:hypothetical protein